MAGYIMIKSLLIIFVFAVVNAQPTTLAAGK